MAGQHTSREPEVMGKRRQLVNLAYRLLGSVTDAEDAVQETYARWYALTPEQQAAVGSPGGWLTTVAGRVCLDVLGSARVTRERYTGAWLPEPLPDPAEWADPVDRVTLDESVHMAFLVVLETMTPAERVAFVLHDVFRYPFAEVAAIVGRTPAACRQLAVSARRRVETGRVPVVPAATQAGVVRAFKLAWEAKDIEALVGLLDPAATTVADGGGQASTVLRPIEGADQVAAYVVAVAGFAPGLTLLECSVNGRPGLVARLGGVTVTVAAFDVTADGRVSRIWAVRNPAKLRLWS